MQPDVYNKQIFRRGKCNRTNILQIALYSKHCQRLLWPRITMRFFVIAVIFVSSAGHYSALPLVTPDILNRTLPNSIDCDLLRRTAPPEAQWIPTCDPTTNQLTPHQITIDGMQFCADGATGINIFGPVKRTLSCDCVTKAYKTVLQDRKPAYVPQCSTKTGDYLPKQCADNGDCWCADKHGTQLGPRWSAAPVNAKQKWDDPAHATVSRDRPRLSCGMVRKFWESWKLRK